MTPTGGELRTPRRSPFLPRLGFACQLVEQVSGPPHIGVQRPVRVHGRDYAGEPIEG